MGGAEQKSPRASVWGTGLGVGLGLWMAAGLPAMAQQTGQVVTPGDQVITFGIDQKFAANDNIRLDPNSVGTTYYSDTTFSFGFSSQTQQQQFNFDASSVLRIVDDPVIGGDSDFRDPGANLFFSRTNGGGRLTAYASYDRPDLAFLDPLAQVDINGQDITNGAGTREDFRAGITLETGLQGPLGLLIDLNTRERTYSNTTDPLLFGNRTDNARVQANLVLSPVATGRAYATETLYDARDNLRTQTETQTVGIGADRNLDPATVLSFDLGYSRVRDTFETQPGVENTFEGYVGSLGLVRTLPDGQIDARLDSALNKRGRQSTLQLGRDYALPRGTFAFSLGASTGDSFNVTPIGSLNYSLASARSTFDAGLSRTVQIDDTLDQITETTRFNVGYVTRINPQSSFDFQVSYADITIVGNNTNSPSRDRLGATATYVRDVAQNWQFRVGYGYRAFYPNVGASSDSNEVFFSLQKVFDIYR